MAGMWAAENKDCRNIYKKRALVLKENHAKAHPNYIQTTSTRLRPRTSLAIYLNTLLTSYVTLDRIQDDKFPLPEKDDVRPFPEDYTIRGLRYTDKLYPEKLCLSEKTEEEEKYHELPSMVEQRKERILWLACRVCDAGP
ncbi:hypothetical protein ACMFMG_011823 [Clarireedia jacksonii]